MLYSLIYRDKSIGTLSVSDRNVCTTLNDGLEMIQIPWEWKKKYENGQRTYDNEESMDWIKERVVPSGRCNIHEGVAGNIRIGFLLRSKRGCRNEDVHLTTLLKR